MPYEWTKPIAAYFDIAADGYARSINPVFAPLVEGLVQATPIHLTDRVLDLGTGTGLAAEAAAKYSRYVVGVDFSIAMLRIASRHNTGSVVCGDIHVLPFAPDSFDIAFASFALNSTDPAAVLSETFRVLRPSGPFMMHEWAENDEVSDLVSELFAEYAIDDPPSDLARLREEMQTPIPWDEIESIDQLAALITGAGFEGVEVSQLTAEVPLPDIDTFIRYKLAWPIRAAEFAAMSPEIQALCLSDLRENVAPFTQRGTGQLTWRPNLVRIRAHKPPNGGR